MLWLVFIYIYICSCQPRVQHGRSAPPCSSCQGIITHTFQLSEIQKAFIVATEHPGCQTKKHEGEFILFSASFSTWILPFNVVRFFFSAVFSSPTFKIKNHMFFGRTCYKNTLSERSKFIFFHEQSGIFQYLFHVFCCSCFSKETYNTPIGRTPLAIPSQRQLFQGIPKHIACWLKGFFRGVVSSSVC